MKNRTVADRGEALSTILKLTKMKIGDNNTLYDNKNKSGLIKVFFSRLIDNKVSIKHTENTKFILNPQKDIVNNCLCQISLVDNLISAHQEAGF